MHIHNDIFLWICKSKISTDEHITYMVHQEEAGIQNKNLAQSS